MLSVIASVAGGAILVVGLLLPIPGLVIAGACVLGAGLTLGASAFSPSFDNSKGYTAS